MLQRWLGNYCSRTPQAQPRICNISALDPCGRETVEYSRSCGTKDLGSPSVGDEANDESKKACKKNNHSHS